MRRSTLGFLLLAGLIVASLLVTGARSATVAQLQPAPKSDILYQGTFDAGGLPVAPVFIRLLRITLDPGASSPLHTHPGPEIGRIESGVLSVTVKGKASVLRATTKGTPAVSEEPKADTEFQLKRGDLITYPAGTALTFRNASTRAVKILAMVILPAGHQHPAGIAYVGSQPGPAAFKGVASVILGDGVASTLPTGPATLTIDRLTLAPGGAIPALNVPVLLSVVKGALDFTITNGNVQISRTANPGPQPDATPGTAFSLTPGDAAFFPNGMSEVSRTGSGDLVLLRVVIASASPGATPIPGNPAAIAVHTPVAPPPTATASAPTATATAAAPSPTTAVQPTASETTATAQTTGTAASGQIQVGSTVTINEAGVRLRSAPSTDSQILFTLQQGQVMVVTGPAEQGSGLTWWPVQDANDATIAGYVAEQFLTLKQ